MVKGVFDAITLIRSTPAGPPTSMRHSARLSGMRTVWPALTMASRWKWLGKSTATRPLEPTLSTVR
jgi:hypothetical protein